MTIEERYSREELKDNFIRYFFNNPTHTYKQFAINAYDLYDEQIKRDIDNIRKNLQKNKILVCTSSRSNDGKFSPSLKQIDKSKITIEEVSI